MRRVPEKHGRSRTPIHALWMWLRCVKGHRVCQRWRESFLAFLEDVGDKPTPRHQLRLKDREGLYCPENCAWVLPEPGGVTRCGQRWRVRLWQPERRRYRDIGYFPTREEAIRALAKARAKKGLPPCA